MSIFLQVVKWIVKMLVVIPALIALIGSIFCSSLYLFYFLIKEMIIRFLLHFDLVDPLLIKNYLDKEIKKLKELKKLNETP